MVTKKYSLITGLLNEENECNYLTTLYYLDRSKLNYTLYFKEDLLLATCFLINPSGYQDIYEGQISATTFKPDGHG